MDSKNNNSITLIIGAGQAQEEGIKCARMHGFYVIAIDGNKEAPGLEHANESYIIDIKDKEAVLSLAKRKHVNLVTSFCSEIALPTVAFVNRELNLQGLSEQQVQLATNKSAMRRKHSENNLPIPEFKTLVSINEVCEVSADLVYPVIVKPADSSGSRGVRFVSDAESLQVAFREAQKVSQSGEVLIEEFMEGDEFAVEAFVSDMDVNIILISEKKRTAPPYLLDTQVLFPATRSADETKVIVDLVKKAVQSLGLTWCPVHMEFIWTSQGPKIVELACRGAGFKVFSEIVPKVTGIDTNKTQLNYLLQNDEIARVKPSYSAACIRFVGIEKRGIVKRISGVKEAKDVQGVSEIALYVQEGSLVNPLTSGADRIGHAIAYADSPKLAEQIMDKAFGKITVALDHG